MLKNFIAGLVMYVVVSLSLMVATSAHHFKPEQRVNIRFFCKTQLASEVHVTAKTAANRQIIQATSCVQLPWPVNATVVKRVSEVKNGMNGDMIEIFKVKIDDGPTVYVPSKKQGRDA